MGCGITNKRIRISSLVNKPMVMNNQSTNDIKTKTIFTQKNFVTKIKKDVYSDYKILIKIGTGSYGKVYKVEEIKTGMIRAMKIIKKQETLLETENNINNKSNQEKNYFLNEIEILKKLDHPNIIKIFDYYNDEKNIYLILEYYSGGDLFEEISNWKVYTEEKACYLIYQILLGVNYMHSNSVIHRDLKPENILLIRDNVNNPFKNKEYFPFNLIPTDKNRNSLCYNLENSNSYGYPKINNFNYTGNNNYSNTINNSNNNNKFNNDINNVSDEKNKKRNNLNEILNKKSENLISYLNVNETNYGINNQNSISSNINLKIIDFGTGRIMDKNDKLCTRIGTPHYVAPELITKKYDEKVDVWACGVIFYMMLVGYLPFRGRSTNDILNSIIQGKYELNSQDWKNISYEVKHLIRCMLTYESKKRISAFDALNHIVFKKMNKNLTFPIKVNNLKNTLDNIRTLNMITKLREATINYLIHYYTTNKQTEDLQIIFQNIDLNKDGKISYSEFKSGCESIFGETLSDFELKMIMESIDSDKSGYIEYQEFIKAFIDKKLLVDENKLRMAFNRFDSNKDGKLSREEIMNIFIEFEGEENTKNLDKFFDIEYKNENINKKATSENNPEDISFELFKKLIISYINSFSNDKLSFDNLTHLENFSYIENSYEFEKETRCKKSQLNDLRYINSENILNHRSKNIKKFNEFYGNEKSRTPKAKSTDKIINDFNYFKKYKAKTPKSNNPKILSNFSHSKNEKSIEIGRKSLEKKIKTKNIILIDDEKNQQNNKNDNLINFYNLSKNFLNQENFDNSALELTNDNISITQTKLNNIYENNFSTNITNVIVDQSQTNVLKEKKEKDNSTPNLFKASSYFLKDINKYSDEFLSDLDCEFLDIKISKTMKNEELKPGYVDNNKFYFKKMKSDNNNKLNLLKLDFGKELDSNKFNNDSQL